MLVPSFPAAIEAPIYAYERVFEVDNQEKDYRFRGIIKPLIKAIQALRKEIYFHDNKARKKEILCQLVDLKLQLIKIYHLDDEDDPLIFE